MKITQLMLHWRVALAPVLLAAQATADRRQRAGVDPASLLKPLAESWPTYSGDYTGRRFSALTQVNRTTVKNLTLAWVARLVTGPGGRRRTRPVAAAAPSVIVGGDGTEVAAPARRTSRARS